MVVAAIVLALWGGSLALLLEVGAARMSTAAIVGALLLRSYLTTGLFITAHDAMHGSVSRRRSVNDAVGRISAFLFAAMSYRRLVHNHALHHAHPASGRDPDYFDKNANFWAWLVTFMNRYATLRQVLAMALLYNLLRLRYDDASLWLFWAGPAFLASLQLFTFGTYLPHRPGPDREASSSVHHARTLKKHHLWAMVSCYFFGYHREHHEGPRTPWWRLYASK